MAVIELGLVFFEGHIFKTRLDLDNVLEHAILAGHVAVMENLSDKLTIRNRYTYRSVPPTTVWDKIPLTSLERVLSHVPSYR